MDRTDDQHVKQDSETQKDKYQKCLSYIKSRLKCIYNICDMKVGREYVG